MKCGACGRTGLQSTQLALVLIPGDNQRRRVCGREFRSFADMMGCVRGKYFAGWASELLS